MTTISIIAEYNPFHNGHAYQIQKVKKQSNADFVVVLMSGDYVQRGIPAITDKYTRTRMALAAGADMVLQLPLQLSTASAEQFAYGGVSILHRLGFIDGLSYGCETQQPSLLIEVAKFLSAPPKEYEESLQSALKTGLPYPLARQNAIFAHHTPLSDCTPEEIQGFLSSPNNILAIEYEKAKLTIPHCHLTSLPIYRENNYHDTDLTSTFPSASAIRTQYKITGHLENCQDCIPGTAYPILAEAERKSFPVEIDDFSTLLYYKLLQTSQYDIYEDCNHSLEKKIIKNLPSFTTISAFTDLLKSKELVHTRIYRSLLHILLSVKKRASEEPAPYVRLLGSKRSACGLLKQTNQIPVITKVADAKQQLSPTSYAQFKKELDAAHLYRRICMDKFGYDLGSEFQHSPIIIQDEK